MPCKVFHLGKVPFAHVWNLQKQIQSDLIAGHGEETLILCEHAPVITIGRSAKLENILVSIEQLKTMGIELFEIERGGDVTYHGPGQLVGYPVLDLNKHHRDVHWYMRSLEQVIINALSVFKVRGLALEGKTGVWVEASNHASFSHLKIASMGVRLSRWVTLHGFAVNVADCSNGFSLINPCGFPSSQMTSMANQSNQPVDLADVEKIVEDSFTKVFYSENR